MVYFNKSPEKRVSPFQLFAAASPPLETPQTRAANPTKSKDVDFFPLLPIFSPLDFPYSIQAYGSQSGEKPGAKAAGQVVVPPRAALPIPTSSSGVCQNPTLSTLLPPKFLLFLSLDSVPRMPPLPVHPVPRRRWLFPSVPAGLDSHRTFPGG